MMILWVLRPFGGLTLLVEYFNASTLRSARHLRLRQVLPAPLEPKGRQAPNASRP